MLFCGHECTEADWECMQLDLARTATQGGQQPLCERVSVLCSMLMAQAATAEQSLRSARAECLAVEAVANGLYERLHTGD